MPTEPRHERTTFRMNVVREASSLQTPLELPDFIRDSFDVVLATTCKFNPFGTLLAGFSSFSISIRHICFLSGFSFRTAWHLGHELIDSSSDVGIRIGST